MILATESENYAIPFTRIHPIYVMLARSKKHYRISAAMSVR